MKKATTKAFGKNIYLLGIDEEGKKHWLEEGKFECGWYWGMGYVETYTNNSNPSKAKDVETHQHFNGLILDKKRNGYDEFVDFFVDTPLEKSEIWELIELMKTLYTMREYSDTIYRGGSHYTTNPLKELIKNDVEYERINKIIIPSLLEKVYELLS